MKTGIIVILILSIVSILNAQEPDTIKYKVLPPDEFIKEFNDNADAIIIDLRQSKDFLKAHIPGAVNIHFPLIREEYFGGPDAVAIDKSLFMYCYVGVSSKKAAAMFYDNGYRNIFSLEGGFNRWKSRKMPVERRKKKELTQRDTEGPQRDTE
jgi:rhodanese-related sulfurtransferase